MDSQTLISSSQTLYDEFNPIIGGFDQMFDDFMFPHTSDLFDNVFDFSTNDLPFEELDGSPRLNWSSDEDARRRAPDHDRKSKEASSSGEAAKPKRDRSKTLVSERRRRSSMKEKLYELRSLVPNITKMDKASIIGDAVVYVQGLQAQAKKLADEISILESSSSSSLKEEKLLRVTTESAECGSYKNEGKILSLMAHEVGEGRFYVRIECSNGDGVASALYSAIESLECFHLENTNLSFTSDKFTLTLSLRVKDSGEMMVACSVKLWVLGALLKEGFDFEMSCI